MLGMERLSLVAAMGLLVAADVLDVLEEKGAGFNEQKMHARGGNVMRGVAGLMGVGWAVMWRLGMGMGKRVRLRERFWGCWEVGGWEGEESGLWGRGGMVADVWATRKLLG